MNGIVTPKPAPAALWRAPSPLQGAQFTLDVSELLVTLRAQQRFRNNETQPIEVSYLCAIPTGAALLDVEAMLGDEVLRGRIEPRATAEDRYETALAEGHSAFCLRMVDDQLLHIALGNLLPGEELSLKLRLGWWLEANDGRLRITVPTVLAPRYGEPKLQPHEQTQSSPLAEYPACVEGRVRGVLAAGTLSCASHVLAMRATTPGELAFSIRNARLDRDIVIDLDIGSAAEPQVSGSGVADIDASVAAMIAFCTPQTAPRPIPVLAEFVLDCSGSMAGSSIEQSRAALRSIVAQLTASDRLNVQRFGSHHQFLLRRPQPLTPVIRQTLLEAAGSLQADLGGTELMPALHAALEDLARLPAELPGERVLFIVSDGEVWNPDIAAFLARCSALAVRVFAVAVGNAAVESTFLPMVTATGGALERVLPADDMAQRIERHFQRVRQGALRDFRVQWPGQPQWSTGPAALYPGDTGLFVASRMRPLAIAAELASAVVQWRDPDGQARQVVVVLQQMMTRDNGLTDQARMIAARRLVALDESASVDWAVAYQLLTTHTGLTLVKQRADELGLDRLPELRIVPQMLATGWAGSAASVMMDALAGATPAACVLPSPAPPQHTPQPLAGSVAKRGLSHLFKRAGAPGAGGGGQLLAHSASQDDPAAELAALLRAHLVKHPDHIALLASGRFNLDLLAQALPISLLNWLDAAAEGLAVELADGEFWAALAQWLRGHDRELARRVSVATPQPRLLSALERHLASA